LAVLFRGHHRGSKRFPSNEREIVICTQQLAAAAPARTGKTRPQRPRVSRVPFQFITDDDSASSASSAKKNIRNLILCTKAFQAERAIQDIQSRLDPSHVRIMILCNGSLDVREKLEQTLQSTNGTTELIMATTTHGVVHETAENDGDDHDDMFHLLHVGVGRTYLGSNISCTKSLAQLFDQSGLQTQSISSQEMEVLLWKKLAANCVCNPLTALWDVPNGRLNENLTFMTLRKQIVEEVSRVGIALHPELRDDLIPASLDDFVEQVIQANLQNQSSMARDLKKHQRTEIDNLNGYIVRKSTELGLPSSFANAELMERIHEITVSYS
jgi:2-dehydropantoate 2-reductase